jgi:aldehyde:ferredoxin oxidoreductase
MDGWMGKILRVDLTAGVCTEEPLDPDVAKDYVGGRGLGIFYLSQEIDAKVDPLSPGNPIIMATGPLTGTGAPTGARYMVMTKSPLTGAITCSNSGGMFPTEFKRTGYDAIIFTGRSHKPVYLWLNRETAELRAADHLWGQDTHKTTEMLLAATDTKAKVACIGPAGEKRVLFASIMNDRDRAAGRSGVGAVMGSKNLKAVVVRGHGRIPLAEPDRFKSFNKRILDTFKQGVKETPLGLTINGTAGVVMTTQYFGALPTKNWQQVRPQNQIGRSPLFGRGRGTRIRNHLRNGVQLHGGRSGGNCQSQLYL